MTFRKIFLLGAFVAATTVLTNGCAYRSDLAQGNFVEQEAVDQLRQGMSAAQVQYILGTPMLTDPFDNTRWYYVHFLRQGSAGTTYTSCVRVGKILKSKP